MQAAEIYVDDQQVDAVVHDLIRGVDQSATNERFFDLVNRIGDVDLQNGRRISLSFLRDRIVEEPATVIREEVSALQSIYTDRSFTTTHSDGLMTEFVTRTEDRRSIDTLYRQVSLFAGGSVIAVESRLKEQLEVPCSISVRDDECHVALKQYRRGMYHDVEQTLGDGGRGDQLLKAFYATTLWASQVALSERLATDQAKADLHAKHVLLDYRRNSIAI